MTASLLVLIAVALLALVSGFCFVGCVLNTHGTGVDDPPKPTPFTKYSDVDVLADPNCIAYWPLDEASPADDSGKITAHDAKGANDGEYKHKGNAAAFFPCPVHEPGQGGVHSAFAPGFLSLGTQSLLPGDAKQPANDPAVLTTGMQTNGAFVMVPLSATINPSGKFSVEVWARREWDDDAVPTLHVLLDARGNKDGAFGGYAIWVNTAGNWEAVIVGTGPSNVLVTAGKAVASVAAHLVLVFDGVKVTLFVDGVASPAGMLPAGQVFSANTKVPLVIGVGNPSLPYRTMPSDLDAFPLFPFKGTIQCVAMYNTALTPDVIKKHFDDGSGKTMLPAG